MTYLENGHAWHTKRAAKGFQAEVECLYCGYRLTDPQSKVRCPKAPKRPVFGQAVKRDVAGNVIYERTS